MNRGFKGDTRRTMQLADNDTFRAINDEGSLRCHERNFAHVNFFFLRAFVVPQLKRHMQGSTKSLALPLTFKS